MKEELEDEEMEADDEEAKKRLSSAVDDESKSYSVLLLIKLIRILISFHLALGHRRCSYRSKAFTEMFDLSGPEFRSASGIHCFS